MKGHPRVMLDGKLQCCTCAQWKLPEQFAPDASRRLGRASYCYACKYAKRKAKRIAEGKRVGCKGPVPKYFGPPKPAHLIDRSWSQPLRVIHGKKLCSACGVWRNVYHFRRNAETVSGLARDCDDCRAGVLARQRAADAAYCERNRVRLRQQENEREAAKRAVMTPEEVERERQYAKQWYAKNKDKVAACRSKPEQRERIRVTHREWKKTPKGRDGKKRYLQRHPEVHKAIGRRQCEQLRDAYIRGLLKDRGFPSVAITPELIAVKRVQVWIERMKRQLQREVKEQAR